MGLSLQILPRRRLKQIDLGKSEAHLVICKDEMTQSVDSRGQKRLWTLCLPVRYNFDGGLTKTGWHIFPDCGFPPCSVSEVSSPEQDLKIGIFTNAPLQFCRT